MLESIRQELEDFKFSLEGELQRKADKNACAKLSQELSEVSAKNSELEEGLQADKEVIEPAGLLHVLPAVSAESILDYGRSAGVAHVIGADPDKAQRGILGAHA